MGLETATFTVLRNDGADDVDGADGANDIDGKSDGESDSASIGASDCASDGASDADGTLDGASTAAAVHFPFLAALDTSAFLFLGGFRNSRNLGGFGLRLRSL